MMMAIGENFVFELKTVPYQTMQLNSSHRYAQQFPIGANPVYQSLGPGEDSQTLQGKLIPEITGGIEYLNQLIDTMHTGTSQLIADSDGFIHGLWIIESVNRTLTEFKRDGTPRRIEFDIQLKFAGPRQSDQVAMTYDTQQNESLA